MTLNYRILILLFIFCAYLPAKAMTGADTSKKIIPPKSQMSYDANDFLVYFKEGILQIKQDNLEKGSQVLFMALQTARKQKNIDRGLPYLGLELFNVIEDINSGKLSPEEKKLGLSFLKTTIGQDGMPDEKAFLSEFKHAPNTVFTRRLHIYVLCFDNPGKMVRELDELLKIKPDLVSANILKVENLYETEKYLESIDYASRVIQLSPQYAYAYQLRGKNLSEINKYEKAVDDFNKAIELFPEEQENYYEKASALLELKKFREAITGFIKVGKRNPYYKSCIYNLARCYKGLEMTDSALYYIDLHIKLYPGDSYGYDIKGDIYYAKDDYPAATELYTHAISINPTKASFYEDRGDAKFYDKKYQDAIIDFKKCISLDKLRAYTNDRIGDCYYELAAYDKAIPYHQKAILIDTTYKYAYVGLNSSYNRTGDYKAAIAAAKKAIEIDSTYDSAYGDLGWTYYLAGDLDACIAYSNKALKYDESATYAMFNIGLATLCKGNFEKAKEIYSYYVTRCKEKGYKISAGASEDLNDLIKKGKFVTEARYILEHIFEEKQ
jgi:tetratricopeptide (TPR) repeat protein